MTVYRVTPFQKGYAVSSFNEKLGQWFYLGGVGGSDLIFKTREAARRYVSNLKKFKTCPDTGNHIALQYPWHKYDKEELGKKEKGEYPRVLAYSEAYEVDDPMRHRLLEYRFLSLCDEITAWAYLEELYPLSSLS